MYEPPDLTERHPGRDKLRDRLLLAVLFPICLALMLAPILLLIGVMFGVAPVLAAADVLGNPVSWIRHGWSAARSLL